MIGKKQLFEDIQNVTMINMPQCTASLLDPGPLGLFYAVAIVDIIWTMISDIFFSKDCNDRSNCTYYKETVQNWNKKF